MDQHESTELSNEDLLKYALESGMINMSHIQDVYDMTKRQEILKNHKWAISQGSDGYWRTYLPDDEKGRRMIKKRDKGEIEDTVVSFYKALKKEDKFTLDDAYWLWRKTQDELVVDSSVARYDSDYKRYFKNEPFFQRAASRITEDDIKVFIVRTTKEKKLCKKATKTLFGHLRNSFKAAKTNRKIKENPMDALEAKQFYKYCTEIPKPVQKRVVSDKDMEALYEQFKKDYAKKPEYIPTYAVHMATLTGMRAGELSGLPWDCVYQDHILIKYSEKLNRKTGEYYIDTTKNGKERIFPMTDEIRELLANLKRIEMKMGYMCEWVFAGPNGRIHSTVISSCSKTKCRQIGIDIKGIHSYRRTLNSKMRCNGVSATVAAALLGHSAQVNEQYYTYDVSTLEEKTEIIANINRSRKIG